MCSEVSSGNEKLIVQDQTHDYYAAALALPALSVRI